MKKNVVAKIFKIYQTDSFKKKNKKYQTETHRQDWVKKGQPMSNGHVVG